MDIYHINWCRIVSINSIGTSDFFNIEKLPVLLHEEIRLELQYFDMSRLEKKPKKTSNTNEPLAPHYLRKIQLLVELGC